MTIIAFFGSFPQKDEVYLNLVLDYVPETVYRVARHYSRAKQTLPMVYVKVHSVCVCVLYRHDTCVTGSYFHTFTPTMHC